MKFSSDLAEKLPNWQKNDCKFAIIGIDLRQQTSRASACKRNSGGIFLPVFQARKESQA
jgi:hypothetical protein